MNEADHASVDSKTRFQFLPRSMVCFDPSATLATGSGTGGKGEKE